MKYGELEKILRTAVTGEIFPVGHHKTQEVPKETLKNILRAAGLENRK